MPSPAPVSIRLPVDVLAALDKVRAVEDRSRSNQVVHYLRRALTDGGHLDPQTAREPQDVARGSSC